MIYFIEAPEVKRIKIGFSKEWQARFTDFLVASPTMLDLIVTSDGTVQHEHALHRAFKPLRHYGEWFNAGPALVEFCRVLKAAPEDERLAIVDRKIAEDVAARAAQKIAFDFGADTACLRDCVRAFVEKHGGARAGAIAGVGPQSIKLWRKGAVTPSGISVRKMAANDPDIFVPFFGFRLGGEQANYLPDLYALQRELGAVICMIEARRDAA